MPGSVNLRFMAAGDGVGGEEAVVRCEEKHSAAVRGNEEKDRSGGESAVEVTFAVSRLRVVDKQHQGMRGVGDMWCARWKADEGGETVASWRDAGLYAQGGFRLWCNRKQVASVQGREFQRERERDGENAVSSSNKSKLTKSQGMQWIPTHFGASNV